MSRVPEERGGEEVGCGVWGERERKRGESRKGEEEEEEEKEVEKKKRGNRRQQKKRGRKDVTIPYHTKSIYGDRVVVSLLLSGAFFFPLWEEKKCSRLELNGQSCPPASLRFWAFGFPPFSFFHCFFRSISRTSSNSNKRLVRTCWVSSLTQLCSHQKVRNKEKKKKGTGYYEDENSCFHGKSYPATWRNKLLSSSGDVE